MRQRGRRDRAPRLLRSTIFYDSRPRGIHMRLPLAPALAIVLLLAMPAGLGARPPQVDGVAALVAEMGGAGVAGDVRRNAWLGARDGEGPAIDEFANTIASPRPARVV